MNNDSDIVLKYKNYAKWSFKGQTLKAYVVDCYDGDTITCSICIAGGYYAFKVRLYGIDTAEIRHGLSTTPDCIQKALQAKELVASLILDSFVQLQCFDFDKYGRILANVYYNDNKQSLNALLIDKQLAYPYFGKTKLEPL